VTVVLESTPTGEEAWGRVSAPVAAAIATLAYAEPQGSWRYRLRAFSRDGRTVYSNEVVP
jgi:hypothetical protein